MCSSPVKPTDSCLHDLEDFPDDFQMILLPSRTQLDHVRCLLCLKDFVLHGVPVRSVGTFAQHGSTCDSIDQLISRDLNLRRFHT